MDENLATTVERQKRDKEEILARLRRVEGQIRGIQRMIEEHRDCEAIVTQLMAARAALDKASLVIMSRHIESCLADSTRQASGAQLERIIELFLRLAGSTQAGEEPPKEVAAEGA